MKNIKISLGNDHFGFPMKAAVLEILDDLGCKVIDHGCYSNDPVDFPDIARKVCNSVRSGEAERGIMICGTGLGASIAANKIPGIRAATVHDVHCAHQGVEHDDLNVLTMGAQIIGAWLAKDIIKAYVEAEFSTNEDFRRRVSKLHVLELDAAKELQKKIE
jgi:ribose 5-phosphate isomerase B